jgi:hypothetical protein
MEMQAHIYVLLNGVSMQTEKHHTHKYSKYSNFAVNIDI